MLDLSRYEWLSFDCYGTLVDWESGITDAAAAVFARHGVRRSKEEILALFADAEPKVQTSGEFLDYRRVLVDVMQLMAWAVSIRLPPESAGSLPDSLPNWPIFPDAPGALKQLQSRYRLAVISNVDDDLFRQSEEALGIKFDVVVTSQQARSYKPNLLGFELAQERMGVERDRWLHVGESLYHDIGPANRLGIDSAWVSRPDRGGGTRRTDSIPSLTVPDLGALAELAVAHP